MFSLFINVIDMYTLEISSYFFFPLTLKIHFFYLWVKRRNMHNNNIKTRLSKKRKKFSILKNIINTYKQVKFHIGLFSRINNITKWFINFIFSLLSVFLKVFFFVLYYIPFISIMFVCRILYIYYYIIIIPSILLLWIFCKIIYMPFEFYRLICSNNDKKITSYMILEFIFKNLKKEFVKKITKIDSIGVFFFILYILECVEYISRGVNFFLRKSIYMFIIIFLGIIIIWLWSYFFKAILEFILIFILIFLLTYSQLLLVFLTIWFIWYSIKYPLDTLKFKVLLEILGRIFNINYIKNIINESMEKKIWRLCSSLLLINTICFLLRLICYWWLYLIKYFYLFLSERMTIFEDKGFFYSLMRILKIIKFGEYLDSVIYFTKAKVFIPLLFEWLDIGWTEISFLVNDRIIFRFTNTWILISNGWDSLKYNIISHLEEKALESGVGTLDSYGYMNFIMLYLYNLITYLYRKVTKYYKKLIVTYIRRIKAKTKNYIRLQIYKLFIIRQLIIDICINRIEKQKFILWYNKPKLYKKIKQKIMNIILFFKKIFRFFFKCILWVYNIKWNLKKLKHKFVSSINYYKAILPKMFRVVFLHTKKKYKEKRLFKANKILLSSILIKIKIKICEIKIKNKSYTCKICNKIRLKWLKIKEEGS